MARRLARRETVPGTWIDIALRKETTRERERDKTRKRTRDKRRKRGRERERRFPNARRGGVPRSLTDLWISLLSGRGWLRRLTRAASGSRMQSASERASERAAEGSHSGTEASDAVEEGVGGLSKLKLAARLHFMSKQQVPTGP